MPRSRASSSDSDYGAPIRITRTQVQPATRSHHSGRHRHHSPDPLIFNANSYLQLPGQGRRARASSTSGQPVPVINNYYTDDRSRSHSRRRGDRRGSSSSSDYHRSTSRRRHSGLPADILVDLTLADRDREDRERREAIKRALADARIKEQDEKREREKIVLEAKLKEELDKKKAEEKEKEIVAEWKRKEQEKKDKAEKEKKEFEEKYEEKVKMDFLSAGYSEATIEAIIKKKKDKERLNRLAIDDARPTFIRVHTKYLSTATLEHYGLPWEYDRQDDDYIIIKRYISHEFQDELFDHTKRIKNRKLLEGPKVKKYSTETDLFVPGGGLYVVKKKPRSKSPAARGFFFR